MKKSNKPIICLKCNEPMEKLMFFRSAKDQIPEETIVYCKNCIELKKKTKITKNRFIYASM